MTAKEHFDVCRERLWKLLSETDFSCGCKSYEGLIEVIWTFPEYFQSPDSLPSAESVIIKLHCYVLGGSRHYEFRGKTFPKAIMRFDRWLKEIEKEERENGIKSEVLNEQVQC